MIEHIPYQQWAAVLGDLLWREASHQPPPTLPEIAEATHIASPRYVVDRLIERKLITRDQGGRRTLRLTDVGRSTARAVEYRVHSKGDGGHTYWFNGSRRYAEGKLAQLQRDRPEEQHWLVLSDEHGNIDWDAPEPGGQGTHGEYILDDMLDDLAAHGVVRMSADPVSTSESGWLLVVEQKDGSHRQFKSSNLVDAVTDAWEQIVLAQPIAR